MDVTVGIDPGATGAAVVLDVSCRVVLAVCWRPCAAGRRVTVFRPGFGPTVRVVATVADVGAVLADEVAFVGATTVLLAVEDAWLGENPDTLKKLSRSAAWLSGPLIRLCRVGAIWWQPGEWRAAFPGLNSAPRDSLKQQALLRVPERVQGLADALLALGSLSDVAEAAGVAYAQHVARHGDPRQATLFAVGGA